MADRKRKADGTCATFWMCGVCDPGLPPPDGLPEYLLTLDEVTLDELREVAKRFGVDLDDEEDPMPRYNPDFSRVHVAELTKEEIEKLRREHAQLQSEDQAEFEAEEEKLGRDSPRLTDAQRATVIRRRLGLPDIVT